MPPTINGELYYWSRNGGGNPKLRPWKANTFDLSFEKYFGNKAYVSVAAYYKDLKTYIFNAVDDRRLRGRAAAARGAGRSDHLQHWRMRIAMGVSTLKSNGSGGYIQGFELTASIPFSLFSDALDGFGFIVSGAKNSSSIKINDDEIAVPGPVQEDHQFDAVLREVRFLGAREQSLPR